MGTHSVGVNKKRAVKPDRYGQHGSSGFLYMQVLLAECENPRCEEHHRGDEQDRHSHKRGTFTREDAVRAKQGEECEILRFFQLAAHVGKHLHDVHQDGYAPR